MTEPPFDLAGALQLHERHDWARTALAALRQPEMTYAGNAAQPGHETVENLLRLYRLRLARLGEGHFQAVGLEQLVTALEERAPTERVSIRPYVGGPAAATGFVIGEEVLGCITVPRAP